MIRLPVVAGILAAWFAVRYLVQRFNPRLVKLSHGRRVKLLSALALRDGSTCRVLALEYVSRVTDPTPNDLEQESLGLLRAVSARPENAGCREALITVRLRGEDPRLPAPDGRVLAFRRFDINSAWYSIREPSRTF